MSDPEVVANEIITVASAEGLNVQVISSYDQLDALVRNPPSNVVVINAHGETLPMPASWGTSWQPYYDQLASDISSHGWTFVSIAGYPVFWLITPTQPIPPSPQAAGLQRLLAGVGGQGNDGLGFDDWYSYLFGKSGGELLWSLVSFHGVI